MREEIENLRLESSISLLGERSDIPELLADADIYLSTSHREGLPLSILEGMAAELPVISTDVGGCSDIVNDNGILIRDNDQVALEAAMVKMALDNNKRKQMGCISKRIAMEYDVSSCAKKYLSIYEDVCKKGK